MTALTTPSVAAGLFPTGVAVEELWLPDAPLPLYPREATAIAHATPKRRREFAAGRWCARRALARLGVAPGPLLNGADRAPHWPAGMTGSISHTDAYVVAVAAPRELFRSLGVDAEPSEPLEEELWQTVCTLAERRWLAMQMPAERGRLARLIFCAKECVYKWQYPLTGAFLEFLDMELSIDRQRWRFAATLLREAGVEVPRCTTVRGRFALDAGLIVAGVAL